jgi:hypothetical protein
LPVLQQSWRVSCWTKPTIQLKSTSSLTPALSLATAGRG